MPDNRIVIVGGGVIGSSIAYHLTRQDFGREVVVIERDPTYRRASSALAMGGIRQQFSSLANIRLAQHSIRFYAHFSETLRTPSHTPDAGFRQRGYLFLVNDAMAERFELRLARQRKLGAKVNRLATADVQRLVPDLRTDDIRFGVFGPDDGYANPRLVLAGFRHAAEAAGARFLADEVTGIDQADGQVRGVTLASGAQVGAHVVVNAAGPFAARLGVLAEVEVPVRPVRQQLFRCALPRTWPYRFPVVIDPTGVHWRHEDPDADDERDRIIIAHTKMDEDPGEIFACDMTRWQPDFLEPLVHRIPALAAIELVNGWAGLYEMTPDHNPVIGEHPDLRGFYLANGFSGHGFMMAPAVGQALAELITMGRSHTIDISPFDVTRFARGEPFWDDAMI